jgi:hypothetical protein
MYILQSSTLSADGSFSLTSIPQTFTHLQLRFYGKLTASGSGAGGAYIGFNGDANISGAHQMYSNGSSTGFNYDSLSSIITTCYGYANYFSYAIVDILDYTNTNKFKSVTSFGGYDVNVTGSGQVFFKSAVYRSTSAIQSLTLTGGGAAITSGSRVDLYGITTSLVTGA